MRKSPNSRAYDAMRVEAARETKRIGVKTMKNPISERMVNVREQPKDVAKRVHAVFNGARHIDVAMVKFDLQTLKQVITLYELQEKLESLEATIGNRLDAEGCDKTYQQWGFEARIRTLKGANKGKA